MTGQIGDLIMKMMGQQDPRDALVAAMAGGGTPGAPEAAGSTPSAGGTAPGTAAPGAPPPPDQTPEAYKSPPQLMELYSELLKRNDINAGINRGVGLIGASLAQEKNRASILDAYGVGSGGETTSMSDPSALVNNMLSMRANQTAAATKAAQRAAVPAIAKQLGIDDQTALFLFDSGKLDSVVAEAQKPDNQLVTDPATGQYHVVNKKTGEMGPGIGGEKPKEMEIVTDEATGRKFVVDKNTKQPIGGEDLVSGNRKTEYVENPTTGGKDLVYSDTKELVPDGRSLPGAGNTADQKDYNAAMRGLTPDDPGYMDFAAWQKAGKGERFVPVGNGKVFDKQTQKFIEDQATAPIDDTDPNDAPILAPGQTDDEYLKKLPRETQDIVKGLTDYTLDISKVSSIRGNERQKLAAAAKRYDPSFDMSQYSARSKMRQSMTSGQYSQAINSSNLVIQHLDKLSKIAKTMDNSSYPMWNALTNTWSKQTGDDEITNFETARAAAAAELAKVFKGTGSSSLTEIKDWEDNLDPNASPKQIQTSIKTLVTDLLGSRLDTIRQQYKSAMGKPADFQILTDKSKKILSDLGVDASELGDGDGATGGADAGDPELDNLLKKYTKVNK